MNEAARRLVGTYELVNWIVKANNVAKRPFGENVVGRLTYTKDGRMWAALMDGEREATGAPSLQGASDQAVLISARNYLNYMGRFEMPNAEQVLHHVEMSLLPDWVGSTQVRNVSWDGPRLILSTPPATSRSGHPVSNQLMWKRMSTEGESA